MSPFKKSLLELKSLGFLMFTFPISTGFNKANITVNNSSLRGR